jgi:hypothetical protein
MKLTLHFTKTRTLIVAGCAAFAALPFIGYALGIYQHGKPSLSGIIAPAVIALLVLLQKPD